MLTVSAREANQQFSRLLDAAEQGETVVITKRGKMVAKLVAMRDPQEDAARRERVRALVEHLRAGALRGGRVADWTRDELYDRRQP
jgi:prevent-host-death family protein